MCFVALFALVSPRLALFVLWLFSDRLSQSMDSWLLPFLGFFLLPWTTLAWAVAWTPRGGVSGFGWFLVILAFLVDLGAYGGGHRARALRAESGAG